jgi:predicted AlkP superfamily pyrophosphatase or phosphodiesterase
MAGFGLSVLVPEPGLFYFMNAQKTLIRGLAGLVGIVSAMSLQAGNMSHLIVVGVDGLSPDGIVHSVAPHMKGIRERGSWTFHARAVMPTSSSPNWASMIMGAGPEQHGITSNDWEPDKHDIVPTMKGPGGIFPTVFSVLREQRPGSILAVYHDWPGFGRLLERKMVDVIENPPGPTNTMRQAVEYLRVKKPTLMFIHLDHVDHAGHEFGHGTDKYYEAVAAADYLIGELLAVLEKEGLRDKTMLLVTADHGGIGKHHGGATMAEIEVPWMIEGPGVLRGHEILAPVNTYDTAATIAYLFKVKAPSAWIGLPVRESFDRRTTEECDRASAVRRK